MQNSTNLIEHIITQEQLKQVNNHMSCFDDCTQQIVRQFANPPFPKNENQIGNDMQKGHLQDSHNNGGQADEIL